MRRCPLPPRTSPLKRTPLGRSGRPLRKRSRKAQQRQAARVACRAVVIQRDRGICRAGVVGVCWRRGSDVHEVLPCGRGGDKTDPTICLLTCNPCNLWIHAHDEAATAMGLIVSSWDGPDAARAAVLKRCGGALDWRAE